MSSRRGTQRNRSSKRKQQQASPSRSLPLAGFGNSKMVRLRYAEQFTLNPSASGIASYVFAANGMYDPNITSTGHQPSGFDQNMAFFDHYSVLESTIMCKYANATGGNEVPAFYDIFLTDTGTVGTSLLNVTDYLENRFATGQALQIGTERGYFDAPRAISKRFVAKNFFRGYAGPSESKFQGSALSNPTEGAFFEIVLSSVGGNDPPAMNMVCIIEYIAILSEPRNIAAS